VKSYPEQDHYEILETHRNANREDIERAYRTSLATYADDSLAGYSVFGEGDAAEIREQIEAAYCVLSDEKLKSEYDAVLGADTARDEAGETIATPIATESEPPTASEPLPIQMDEFIELDDGSVEFDGDRLRRYRIRCGLEIEDIAGITKINPTYLRFIEEERFQDLPASVYVRGFVAAYGSCIGLDSQHVAASYMKHFDQFREERRKGRFFDGR
jgi:flagellar biosynthesis protein FlhG